MRKLCRVEHPKSDRLPEPRNANYGVSDVLSNFAAQCEHDTRLHFLAGDVLYPELIDPESAQPLPIEPGREGELVLTHLERDCQPLVRFRSGDIIAVDATEPCRCGRTGMRFRVVGRSDDMIVVRGLNIFPTMVAALLGEFRELSGDYRIVLDHNPPKGSEVNKLFMLRRISLSLQGAQRGAYSLYVTLCATPNRQGKTSKMDNLFASAPL